MLPLIDDPAFSTLAEFKRIVRERIGPEASLVARFWIASSQQKGEVARNRDGQFRVSAPKYEHSKAKRRSSE